MAAKKRRKKRSGFGRFLEVLASGVLLLVVVAFAVSIAARYGGGEEEVLRPADTDSPSRPLRPPVEAPVESDRPTVDIRNGCGRIGLAEEMMLQLRRAGFDVVEYKNADNYDYPHTLIKDRAGKPEAAGRVCAWMQREYGVGESVREVMVSPPSDVLLILGADLADTLASRERKKVPHG